MRYIFCISAFFISSCYGMNPFNHGDQWQPNNSSYRYVTLDNRTFSAPVDNVENADNHQQNTANANISDASDTSEDDALLFNQNRNAPLVPNHTPNDEMPISSETSSMDEEDDSQPRHYDTYTTPSEIDYPTTPTSSRSFSHRMSED